MGGNVLVIFVVWSMHMICRWACFRFFLPGIGDKARHEINSPVLRAFFRKVISVYEVLRICAVQQMPSCLFAHVNARRIK